MLNIFTDMLKSFRSKKYFILVFSWNSLSLVESYYQFRIMLYDILSATHHISCSITLASKGSLILFPQLLNFMCRMYWAKKILEWTRGPEEALEISLYLNDKVTCITLVKHMWFHEMKVVRICENDRYFDWLQYELDGRDPNGYVGCMWSICGVHDQVRLHCSHSLQFNLDVEEEWFWYIVFVPGGCYLFNRIDFIFPFYLPENRMNWDMGVCLITWKPSRVVKFSSRIPRFGIYILMMHFRGGRSDPFLGKFVIWTMQAAKENLMSINTLHMSIN